MKKIYNSSEETGAPLSVAYEVNNLIFVSGQIHRDHEGVLIQGTIQERFDVIMKEIKSILKQADLTTGDIIKVNIYLTNLDELPELNQIYKNYFQGPLPARTAIGVKALPLGASLEIDVIAVRDN